MREHFTVDWAFGIRGAIESTVRANFPQDLRTWPLLQSFNFESYTLHDDYLVVTLKDKLSGIPAELHSCLPFPGTDLPTLPPRVSDIELWQFYFRSTFSLRDEDAAFLIPVRDSGTNVSKDWELFSVEERLFWNHQITHVVARYKSLLQARFTRSFDPPSHITNTYHVSGPGARVNVNSTDLSRNVISTHVSKVFADVREAVTKIPDPQRRKVVEDAVDAMEQAHGSSNFLEKYQAFVALAADHLTILAPIIPALTSLLS